MTLVSILSAALLALAVLGAATSTVYSLMVAVGVLRFRQCTAAGDACDFLPPVSLLKPLHGDEPNLEENLASFFQQDYPQYEILFCARHVSDAGLEVARRVAARFPDVPCSILTCGEPPWPNARTFSLEIMRRAARYPILVATDSDVSVAPDYLASVVQPLRDARVGMVTCLYRGVACGGAWAQLEAMGMSVEMTSGVLVAEMLERMRFALGPSMVLRQSTLEKIGGFEPVAQFYADDFVLGNWIAKSGEKVVLSTCIIEHHLLSGSFKNSIAHQQGWATSTRFSRPLGHFGSVMTFAVPYGLLGLVVLAAAGHPVRGAALLAVTVLNRVLLCLLVAGCVVNDRAALRHVWLYPVRDLMGFCFWIGSYFGSRRLSYRGDPCELMPHGRLRKLARAEEPEESMLARQAS
jgi:ceramide glucosyltransferase